MATTALFTLDYTSRNIRREVSYDSENAAAGGRAIVFTDSRIDPDQPQTYGGVLTPDAWRYALDEQVTVVVEGYDEVTIYATHTSPFARFTVADTTPAGTPDIEITDVNTNGLVISFQVSTSRPPFSTSLSQQAGSFVENQTSITVDQADVSYTIYAKDAAGFRTEHPVYVTGDGAGGGPGEEGPNGVLIDQFTQEADGIENVLYYRAGPPRSIFNSRTPATGNAATVTEAVRGRADGAEITRFTEGSDTVRILARLTNPFAEVSLVVQGPDFTLFSSTPFAPVAPATTGRWQVDTSGGTAPRQVSIPGSTPAGGTLLDSTGYAEITGLLPGSYVATLTDSSSPAQILVVNFTVPATTVDPGPTHPPALPGPPPQNLETFPFTDETPFDQLPTLCPDPAYYLASPQGRFLPFCLRLPRTPDRWLQCARVLDAVTGDVLQEFDPRLLSFQKFEDATSAYFLYYGSGVAGLVLPLCRPLRLRIDEMTSVAFLVQSDLSSYLWCRWWHDTPLQHLPYGTGLQQHLYVPGAVLREQDPREERTETKSAATAAVRVDFLAQARTVSFETEPLPAWLVQAVQGSRLHAWFAAGSSFYQGEYPVREAKQSEFGALSCARSLRLTLEYAPVAVSGCGPQPPALVALPTTYPATC